MIGYGKIFNLGNIGTERALIGPVVVQEKVDGSQFRFGIYNGKYFIGSKKQTWDEGIETNGMFATGAAYVRNHIFSKLDLNTNITFFGEYLQKPKHNTISYGNTPLNNIVLFDCVKDSVFIPREDLEKLAKNFGIDVIPELYRGDLSKEGSSPVEFLNTFLEKDSYLGGDLMEGVVIKNYNEKILLGGKTMNLFTKIVRESFKEKHRKNPEFANRKSKIDELIDGYESDARLEKAYQHLRDEGKLEGRLQDIPKLIKETMQDLEDEETENFKSDLYKIFKKDWVRAATRRIPIWYKNKLLENLEDN